ncbi:MAG TPA: ABC transporter substrate-binding protein, partial [Gemmatimonadales bacterium]|nr:ABC transporter substrate-binding protein [Gemmatimonadales bacterium]
MTRWTRRLTTHAASTLLCSLLPAGSAAAQRAEPSSIVIVTGQDASLPIPTLMEAALANQANFEIADQLFLHLAALGPTLLTAGDHGFVPQLARRWVRRDSVTLAFELDPRARWHDGAPVTARDVLFTFGRARDPAIAPTSARLLRELTAVEAEGDRTVVFRFNRAYAEQLYDAVFHVAPLPAHLLDTVPPADLPRSDFVRHPVGNGPYRWVRSVPGELIELAANNDFFLGRPGIQRVVVRVAEDPNARVNLLLSGEADAMDNIPPPPSNRQRVIERGDLRLLQVPSPMVAYLLYNQRDPHDRSRPHPILSDSVVRRALTLALDRRVLVRAVLGREAEVPYGPASSLLWIRHGAPPAEPADRAAARRLLASRGWSDSDGDGVLDRAGRPLALGLNYPASSAVRQQMALLIQEQWRGIGVRAELVQLDGPVWNERRNAGAFDVDFSGTLQDPTPSGLTQSWSCEGKNNVGRYCDPVVDSLLARAIRGGDREPAKAWHAVLRQIEATSPATFLYAPINV